MHDVNIRSTNEPPIEGQVGSGGPSLRHLRGQNDEEEARRNIDMSEVQDVR